MTSTAIDEFKEIYSLFEKAKPIRYSNLLILGLLSHQNLSGYDIHNLIEKRFSQRYGPVMSMTKATVYNILSRFEKKGLVKLIDKTAAKGRPTKYIFGLTDDGRELLRKNIVANFQNPPYLLITPFFSLFFFNNLSKKEVRDLLKFKIDQMESMMKISEPYTKALPEGITKVLTSSSIRIYLIILDLLKELRDRLEKEPVSKTYSIDTFIEEEFLDMVLKGLK